MLNEQDHLEIPVVGKTDSLQLVVYPQSPNAKVFEESEPTGGEPRYQLQEGCTYEYEFIDKQNANSYQFEAESEIVKFNRNKSLHANMGTLNTGIYVGTLSLDVCNFDSLNKVGKVNLEIRSSKTDYKKEYRLMLEDIARYYTDLVLQQGSPVTQKLEFDQSSSYRTLYQRFSFVRSLVDSESFSEAIHKVISNPVRKWTDANIDRSIVGVKRLTRKNIREIASGTDRINLSKSMMTGLPQYLKSVPRKIEIEYKRDTTDCLENQFVKFVLRTFVNFCAEIQRLPNAKGRLEEEAKETTERLYEYLDNQFFRQISQPSHMNLNSPVLQRKEGYREVLQDWLLFDLAAKLNWDGGNDVYDAGKKNVATLYEYWLFFKLLELVSEFFNIKPQDVKDLVHLDQDGINLSLKQGKMEMVTGRQETFSRVLNVAFYYNRTFNRVPDDKDPIHTAGSWTMSMRPDYTLSLWPGNIREEEAEKQELITHIHFDAKYRLNKVVMEDEDADNTITEELDEEKQKQELKIYKRGDLLKMHAYKDAIRRTSGAYVLYPGEKNRELRGFHEIVPGLGAFRVRPGHWLEDSVYLKQFLKEVKTHLLDRTSNREKLSYYQYDIHLKPKESMLIDRLPEAEGENRSFMPDETYVLVGYYKNQEQLDWILSHNMYNFRAGDRRGSIHISQNIAGAKYILLHDHKSNAQLFKLTSAGPMLYGYEDLKNIGYPYDPLREEENKKHTYLVFQLNHKGVEKELERYRWTPLNIPQLRKSVGLRYSVILLSELLHYASIKE